jgi:2-(1,2-epoxy-1,2-dihydrophenyl)acetyl-CoA isomerase
VTSYESRPGLRASTSDGRLELVLDRPEKRNSLSDEMVAGLISALTIAGSDEAIRVILLKGEGEHFCGGFDIVARNRDGGRPRMGSIQRRLPSEAHGLLSLMTSVQTPVVCEVRGWAAGIGLHLALAADFTVVAEDARLWEPFSQRGFTPDSGATWLLPRRIGDVRAREMLVLGRRVSGAEAADWGMVHRSVPGAELEREVEALMGQLASGPTVALGLTKWLLLSGASSPLDSHLHDEALAMELSARTEDFREGLAAFKEKRAPEFKGR